MKMFVTAFVATLTMTSAAFANQPQENFNEVLSKIQDTRWKGGFSFTVSQLGLTCSGPIDVLFFPAAVEPFSEGATTVSYRHDADFSQNRSIVCRTIGKNLSNVDTGRCDAIFPKKFSAPGATMVPFRTIIPRENGSRAFVSSPSCGFDGKVKRGELELIKAELSPDQSRLLITILVQINVPVVGEIRVPLNYELGRH